MVYPRWSAIYPDLQAAQQELEDYYEKDQDVVLEKVRTLHGPDITAYLTETSAGYTDMMMKRWDRLARYIIVKHNDMVRMQVGPDGEIDRNRKYDRPGYDDSFNEQVAKDTGKRYEIRK